MEARHTSNSWNYLEVKRSKVKVTWLINAETEIVLPTNFKLDRRLGHALSTAMASYKNLWSWVIARGQENTVSATLGGHTTCFDMHYPASFRQPHANLPNSLSLSSHPTHVGSSLLFYHHHCHHPLILLFFIPDSKRLLFHKYFPPRPPPSDCLHAYSGRLCYVWRIR